MTRSLAVLCVAPEGTLRFAAMPDRRQSPDRRRTPRGGRRKGDVAVAEHVSADFSQAATRGALARV
jgi:hypothetical protein